MSKSVKDGQALKPTKFHIDELRCQNAIFKNIWRTNKSPNFRPLYAAKLKMVGIFRQLHISF